MNTIIVPYKVYKECTKADLDYPYELFMFYGALQIRTEPATDGSYAIWEISIDQASIYGKKTVYWINDPATMGPYTFEYVWGLNGVSEGRFFGDIDLIILLSCYTCLNIMGYIMQKGLERQREYRKSGGRKYKYSREYRLSTSFNKIYLFDDIVNYVSEKYIPSKAHHEIQCPCWEVRGHYRHYKSGKLVFIPSYKKGKQKDKAQPKPKEYVIG